MSNVFKGVFSVLSTFVFIFLSTTAFAAQWQIIESSGTVRTTSPVVGATLVSTGNTLNAGDILSTGFDGRVVLARDDQQIVVGPNSRMSLPAAEEPGMTRILQDIGTLLFKVDKRQEKHFRVETPVIAAVVKGTTFTVTAGAEAHAVHVAEGAVEVSTRNGMATELVTAGRTVRIDRNNPSAIRFSDQAGRGGDVEPYGATDVDAGDREASNAADNGASTVREAALDGQADTASGGNSLVVPTTIGAEPLDFATLTDGLVRSPEGRGPAFGLNRANEVSGAAATPADAAAHARLGAMNNSNAARALAAVENGANRGNANGNSDHGGEPVKAPGNENGNAGNSNGAGNAGNGNENGNAGNSNGAGNTGNGNENGNAGNSNGTGNAGNGNGNGGGNGTGNEGNGNGNGGGNGTGNEGNGNGNAGNGNGNGGGNGNGNGNGGNGNGNGGNGNGNAKKK